MTRVCYSRDSATEPEEACGSLNNLLNQLHCSMRKKNSPNFSDVKMASISLCANSYVVDFVGPMPHYILPRIVGLGLKRQLLCF